MSAVTYPAHIDAQLEPRLSRWIWLVKWFLVIPHLVVLAFLWVAFVVLSIGAFFSILFTGRYPRSIFEFNVGVLRWSWRVSYYTYGALGTDRYPPFTLAEVPDYPAHFEVEYPEHLSRGLVLIKWWLLAIPHYLIIGLFVGGGAWAAWRTDTGNASWGGGAGLITILVLISAVMLAFTGRYPQSMFDLVLGLNRWVLRVAAYAGLMTDEYPPFRLDMGGHEQSATLSVPPSGAGTVTAAPTTAPEQAAPTYGPPQGRGGWTPARIIGVVVGALLVLTSIGMLATGGTALWADRTQRDAANYISLGTDTFDSNGYAVATDRITLEGLGVHWGDVGTVIGKVRFEVTSTTGKPVFIGITRANSATTYLNGVAYTTVGDVSRQNQDRTDHLGTAPSTLPTSTNIWTAKASGAGEQTLIWPVKNGTWTIVAMNADGSPGVSIEARTAATLPALPWIATGLLVGGAVFLVGGVLLIMVPVRRASGQTGRSQPTYVVPS
jgi:hypothetical protein